MKADIHLGPNFKSNSEIYKNTKFEEIEYCFNISQKLVMEHSEVILNVKCLEHSSPSWARSVVKPKVCDFADSVLCVGQMRDTPDAIERWTSQVEGLKLYSSYQDAVGIDGEAIEVRVKNFFKFFIGVLSSRNPARLGMTLSGKRMMRIVLRIPRKSRITR